MQLVDAATCTHAGWFQSARITSCDERGTDAAAHAWTSAPGTLRASPGSLVHGSLGSTSKPSSAAVSDAHAATRRQISAQTVSAEVRSSCFKFHVIFTVISFVVLF